MPKDSKISYYYGYSIKTINIKNNFTIQTVDSMNYLDCDSLGNSTDSIVNRTRLEKLISIDKNGRFKIENK